MKLWMKVTDDEYELPIAIGDSAKELAARVGVTENVVHTLVYRKRKGINKSSIYVKVEIEDE